MQVNITNNIMSGEGGTESAFGGGGIYVNGAAEKFQYESYNFTGENGELHLKNAIIEGNTSKFEGAGYAACPISNTIINVNDGVALYDNNKNDLYVYCDTDVEKFGIHAGNPQYRISRRMLGGALNKWMQKKDDKLFPENQYEKILKIEKDKDSVYLYNANGGNALTDKLAKVYITGNTSTTRGGGIGSNGSVFFGTEEKTTKVSVEKKWEDNNNKDKSRPTSVKVKLIAGLKGSDEKYVVEERILNEENNWKTTFTDLPTVGDEKKITYTVSEEYVKGYEAKISGSQEKGYTITNTYIPPEKPPEKPKSPETSDRSHMNILCIALMATSFVALTVLRRKQSC